MSTPYENIKKWILQSGLVISDPNDINYGAVHSFFEQSKGEYGFLYSEITGYAASTFSFLYKIEQNENFLKLAKASSYWLIDIFDKFGGIVQGIGDKRTRTRFAYSFDTAICTKGLLDYYSLKKDEKILDYAKKFSDWLIDAVDEDGTLFPFMDLQTQKFSESDEVWYKKKGCLHIKTAIPLLQLYKVTRQKNLLKIAENICNNYSRFQNYDGSFSLYENSTEINLHTQSYALEGLLFAFSVTKNEEYLKSCKKALDWCSGKIQKDGSINLWFNSKYDAKAVYPIAQIIRLMILLDKIYESTHYKSNIDKLISFMISLQAKEGDRKVLGGFYEEFYKSMFGWKKRQKLNSWGSFFAIQALNWFDNYNKIKFDESINLLY